jgi:hypothetical protein
MSEMTVHVNVPVDAMTAELAHEAGYEVRRPKSRTYAELTLECRPSDEIAKLASDHARPRTAGTKIELDLSRGLKQIVDESPPIPADVPGPSRSPLWDKPEITQRIVQPVHLPSSREPSELPEVVCEWIRTAGYIDPSLCDELTSRWQAQANRMLAHATEVASCLPPTVSADERQGVLKRLEELAAQVRHARDGGLVPHEPDYFEDDFGDRFLEPAHWYVNRAYNEVLDACDRASTSGGDRLRSNDVQSELSAVLFQFDDDAIPSRFIAARKLGLLGSMIGAARDELFEVVWPGWRYPSKDEDLRDVSSPQLAVLERLSEERQYDKANRPWEHDSVTLKWLEPAKHAVLASSFLGREIILDLASSDRAKS